MAACGGNLKWVAIFLCLTMPAFSQQTETPSAVAQGNDPGPYKWPIERRQDQVRTEPGYMASPMAVNIPGLGFFYGVMGSYFNLLSTEADIFGFKVWGDLDGVGIGLMDVPLYFSPLSLNFFWSEQETGIDSHRRGMDSDPEDVQRIEIKRFGMIYGQLSLRLFEKRLQLHTAVNRLVVRTGSIFDKDGEKIADTDGDEVGRTSSSLGSVIDITDDRSDPRKGVQLEVQRYDRPDAKSYESDYYVMDYNLTGYVPVGKFSTIALNAYRSDAVVTRSGETDEEEVRQRVGVGCSSLKTAAERDECRTAEDEIVGETLADNHHGTATSLGGTQRLRSYVTNRFYGAHSLFFGSEFRWNLTEEFTPFNYIVMGGIRSGLQFAFFAEYGGVADLVEDLGKDMAYSYGAGFRLLIASGFIVRFDIATGKEGTQPSLIFSYPWAVF